MAVVKRVLVVVQEWLGDTGHHPQFNSEHTIENARLQAQMMRQMYL
jgi:hypothetical protein